jgi:hypothetical protein
MVALEVAGGKTTLGKSFTDSKVFSNSPFPSYTRRLEPGRDSALPGLHRCSLVPSEIELSSTTDAFILGT